MSYVNVIFIFQLCVTYNYLKKCQLEDTLLIPSCKELLQKQNLSSQDPLNCTIGSCH